MNATAVSNHNKPPVFVALSGGVDSATTALLLQKQGYEVTGVFMKNWSGEEYGLSDQCPWKKDQEDAQAVCDTLNVPFKTYNFEKEYRHDILSYFFHEYEKGRTPNPDVLCNQDIKFGLFMKRAVDEGADLIATGHYAQKVENSDGTVDLVRAIDSTKDQTYFLHRLTQEQLTRSLFPLGDLTKANVREIAKTHTLPVAKKKDSQGICFLGSIDVQDFLRKELKEQDGDIVDIDTGKSVGTHNGVWFYTNGQREGIGIGGIDKPYFVCGKDVKENMLYVAKGKDNPRLYAQSITLSDVHWINTQPEEGVNIAGVVRYRQEPQPCKFINSTVSTVVFETPVWLPSPGQSAVLFDGNIVLGGGIIEEIQTIEANT